MSLLLYFYPSPLIGLPDWHRDGTARRSSNFPYRATRFMIFLRPDLDPKGIGYHINQAVLAIGSVDGLALGTASRVKFCTYPKSKRFNRSSDGRRDQFLFMVFFIVAIGCLVWRCFTIAKDARIRRFVYRRGRRMHVVHSIDEH